MEQVAVSNIANVGVGGWGVDILQYFLKTYFLLKYLLFVHLI